MSVLNAEWLNTNSQRAYPFAEDASLAPSNVTGVMLPAYVVVDAVLTLPEPVFGPVYLSELLYTGKLLTLVFRFTATGTTVGSVSVDTTEHVTNAGYNFVGSGANADVRGTVVFGELSQLTDDLPAGSYIFTSESGALELAVVRPALPAVRSVTVDNLTSVSAPLSGAIRLLAGSNIRLVPDVAAGTITIHATANSEYVDTCPCSAGKAYTPIKTINGVNADDVVLTGDSMGCTEVSVSGNIVTIRDKCSTPCCGCAELKYVDDALKVIETSVKTLQTYATALAARVDTFVANYILEQ